MVARTLPVRSRRYLAARPSGSVFKMALIGRSSAERRRSLRLPDGRPGREPRTQRRVEPAAHDELLHDRGKNDVAENIQDERQAGGGHRWLWRRMKAGGDEPAHLVERQRSNQEQVEKNGVAAKVPRVPSQGAAPARAGMMARDDKDRCDQRQVQQHRDDPDAVVDSRRVRLERADHTGEWNENQARRAAL